MKDFYDLFSKAGTFTRDIFNYILPAIPFILGLSLIIPVITDVSTVEINKYIYVHLGWLDYSIIREVVFLAMIYFIGRLLNELSYPIFSFLFYLFGGNDNKRKHNIFKSLERYKQSNLELIEQKLPDIYSKFDSHKEKADFIFWIIQNKKPDVYHFQLERMNLVLMFEQSILAGILLLTIMVCFITSISWLLKIILLCSGFISVILFFSGWLASYTDINYALIFGIQQTEPEDNILYKEK